MRLALWWRDREIFFDEPVQGRDIGAMMAIMVDRHGRRIDIGLERVEPIAERRNLKHGLGRRVYGRE